MSQRVWLEISEARKLLQERTGFRPDTSVLHTAVQNKKVRKKDSDKPGRAYHGNSKRILFHRADLESLANYFNAARLNLIPMQDAYQQFQAKFPDLTLEQFTILIEGSTTLPVAARLWKMNFFRQKDIDATLATLTPEAIERLITETATSDLLSMAEAVEYLSQKFGKAVKKNTVYVMMERGSLVPTVKPPAGTREGYKFSRASLDAIVYREHHRRDTEIPPIVPIRSSEDMQQLVEKHGELVSTPEAVKLIQEKNAGWPHDVPTLKRRLRNRVHPVGKAGVVLYFPKKKVLDLPRYPLHGAAIASAKEE